MTLTTLTSIVLLPRLRSLAPYCHSRHVAGIVLLLHDLVAGTVLPLHDPSLARYCYTTRRWHRTATARLVASTALLPRLRRWRHTAAARPLARIVLLPRPDCLD